MGWKFLESQRIYFSIFSKSIYGEKATIYEVLDKKGNIAGQYVMFNKDATNYLLYLIPYTQVEQTKEERQGSAIKKLLNDLIIDM